MADLIRYLDHVNTLKRLPRTGWLLNGVVPCESIADHTCAVALLAIALAEAINREWEAEGLERRLDAGRVAQIGLVHDLAESVLTDLPKRSTELIGSDIKHQAESAAIAGLQMGLPHTTPISDLWTEYDAASTPEARLVRDADKLEMVHQALQYARAGNRNLAEFWEGHHWFYAASARVFAELVLQRAALE